MAVSTEFDRDSGCLTLRVRERFDFSLHKRFREAYQPRNGTAPRSYVVDLAETEEMDSSALGMLLLLREYAGGERSEIHIVNCSPAVRNILRVAGLETMFALH
jgi:anti-anti-sigma factor